MPKLITYSTDVRQEKGQNLEPKSRPVFHLVLHCRSLDQLKPNTLQFFQVLVKSLFKAS